jgi:hypothetical protein
MVRLGTFKTNMSIFVFDLKEMIFRVIEIQTCGSLSLVFIFFSSKSLYNITNLYWFHHVSIQWQTADELITIKQLIDQKQLQSGQIRLDSFIVSKLICSYYRCYGKSAVLSNQLPLCCFMIKPAHLIKIVLYLRKNLLTPKL